MLLAAISFAPRKRPLSPSNDQHSALPRPLPDSRHLLEALAGCLVSRWDDLLKTRRQTLQQFETDQIHDLRVASRRLRSVIEQLGPFAGRERMERLRKPVRRLTRELGGLRNLDEASRYFADSEGAEPVLQALQQRRRHEARRAYKLLATLDCMKLERQIRSAAAALVTPDNIASQGILAVLSERNLQLYQVVHGLLPLAAAPEMVEERHALRIAIKKWRYFSELLHAMLGHGSSPLLTLLRQYQSVLGDLQDRAVYLELLDEAAGLPEAVRLTVQKRIVRQQRQLLKKFCVLLDSKPLHYHFEL